jgi:hypothetical protein
MNVRFNVKGVGLVAHFVACAAVLAMLVTPIASRASPSTAGAPQTTTVQAAVHVSSKPPRLTKSRARGMTKAIAKADCKDRLIDHRHDTYRYKCRVHEPECNTRFDDYRILCTMDYVLVAQLKEDSHPDYNRYCSGALRMRSWARMPHPPF